MRKIYLFFLALMCMMGATSALAQKTDLSLYGANAQRIDKAGWDRDVPSATQVADVFGNDTYLSTNGMIWGLGNGDASSFTSNEFTNGSATGFKYNGRYNYLGEYVAQMYVMTDDVRVVNVSFRFAGETASNAFSVWKVSDGTATQLTAKKPIGYLVRLMVSTLKILSQQILS